MDHPAVDIGANWYFDNDGEYGLGHICPMVFGKALDPEDFKHLSMGFGGDENGIFGQLYNGNTPSGAGSFYIDNVNCILSPLRKRVFLAGVWLLTLPTPLTLTLIPMLSSR